MLAYSDSVYYYGQYTEAGSGSFLGATTLVKLVVRNTIDRFLLVWYCALQCRHYVAKSTTKKKNDSTWYIHVLFLTNILLLRS